MKFGPVATGKAAGAILAHSLALTSGRLRKGHVLRPDDIAVLQEQGVETVIAAMLFAWAFTDAVLDWFGLDANFYRLPVAALIALTGEGVAKWIVGASSDPTQIIALVKSWRGK